MTACSYEGCDLQVLCKKLCVGHYRQLKRGQPLSNLRRRTPKSLSTAERLEFHTDKNAGSGCWIWRGNKSLSGYGKVTVNGKVLSAHRVAYALANNVQIPEGTDIDHMCHNKACVKPSHLQMATRKQNSENRASANSNSSSGVRGVTYVPATGRWHARVGHNWRVISVGHFGSIEEAATAVAEARLRLHTNNLLDRGSA